jgi:hypothetical protein
MTRAKIAGFLLLCLLIAGSTWLSSAKSYVWVPDAACGTLQCKSYGTVYINDNCTCDLTQSTQSVLTCISPSNYKCRIPDPSKTNPCDGKCVQNNMVNCQMAPSICDQTAP